MILSIYYKQNLFSNDLSKIPDNVSYTLLHHFIEMGPCQPYSCDLFNNIYLKCMDSARLSLSFHE